jgi:hypothetical protein
MFGRRYFGARHYAPRYFGEGGAVVAPDPGGAIVGGFFSRRRWRELRELMAAEQAAAARAAQLREPKAKRALARAAAATADVIEDFNADKGGQDDIERLTAALRQATAAQRLSRTLAHARQAERVAIAIKYGIEDAARRARKREEEEEEEMLIVTAFLTLH